MAGEHDKAVVKAAEPKAAAKSLPPVSLGDGVLIRVGGEDEAPDLRPATVTRVWGQSCVSLMVFMDGPKDHGISIPSEVGRGHPGIRWCQSVSRGDGLGEWRLPV